MDKKIKDILSAIPKSEGIYKFFDKNGKIIYIGKSVKLYNRVNSYFNGNKKLNFAKQKMVLQIKNIETILTNNETESLILETTLIKKYEPKYNILMKDGKNHIYIKITNEEYPKIIKTRFKSKDGTYFGPYTSTNYVINILKVIKKIFGYGIGEHHFFNTKQSYNLDKYIFKNKLKIEDYNNVISNIKNFLKGNINEVRKILENDMHLKAKELKFEEALKIKEKVEAIKTLEISQIVRDGVIGDYNIINYIQKFDNFYIGLIEIRNSKITGYYNFEVNNKLEEKKEIIITKFLEKYYIENDDIKSIYLLNNNCNIDKYILLKKVKIEYPIIGTKKDLLALCYKNIYEYAYKKHIDSLSTKGFTKKTMSNLLDLLGYKKINNSIVFECNDISHISGNHTVASRSIIENGKSNTSKYKKFKIKTLEEQKIDDFNSMREITIRRIKEIKKTGYYPDLIIIDGGKGQLSSVVEIIKLEGLKIQVIGIAKREEELFLPGESKPIILSKESNELKLIQKIRDEAHRFAITFNRDSRIKSMKKNILDELPGFGPVTRKKILKNYGNIDKLKNIKKTELSKLLNSSQIQTLEDHGLI